ncbi:hypothetical protein UCRPC4_g05998 [Phaeomoniella chlamydospora]|uniref:DNA replication regulator Sld3 C-terminal domain-containing protein n=1 Tax=Phaeomoniella chlamydospora TaxID=158046 RepID=A0A0G2FWJ3_PHACM|nr:hypothetical protein UCRPC4_g05998 [Phaeomoniella chlamydospora]
MLIQIGWLVERGREKTMARIHQLSLQKTPESTPVALNTICPLSRFSFPLAWLDTSGGATLFPSGNVCQLGSQLDTPYDGAFSVLAVKHVATEDLFLLEKLEKDIYTSIKLADWITETMIKNVRDGKPHGPILQRVLAAQAMNDRLKERNRKTRELSAGSLLQPGPPPKQPKMKKGAMARMAILPHADSQQTKSQISAGSRKLASPDIESSAASTALGQRSEPCASREELTNVPTSAPPQNVDQGKTVVQEATDDADALLEKLHSRYLETLYTSKTSVAYFAKGPLARARAAFSKSQAVEGSQILSDPSQLAQFYRDSIISLRKMDLKYKETLVKSIQKNDEADSARYRKRKKTQPKIGKDGLYPDEAEFVQRWWQSTVPDLAGTSSEAELQRLKDLSTELRSRETQLQILIILEAMILEMPSEANVKRESEEPDLKNIPTKKKQDLRTHLDLLVDRLCIWQTVSFEEFTNDKAAGKKTNDKLRDFCSDVIIPFYASKLPDRCKALCKKLGGPSDISPNRPRAPLDKSSSASRVLPGMEVKRSRPTSLQRALTEDVSRSRPPSLPSLKRESSERPLSRSGLHAKLMENRQIDLFAAAKQQESKTKKLQALAEQKKQLDAAISMLRKPNRGVVAKSIVEEVEQRQQISKDNRGIKGIQVMATPRKRKANELQADSQLPEAEVAPEIFAVPLSTVRSKARQTASMPDHSIQETPSHGESRRWESIPSSTSLHQTNLAPCTMPTKSSKYRSLPPTFVAVTPTMSRTSDQQLEPHGSIEATPDASRISGTPIAQIRNTPLTTKLRMTKSQKPVEFTPLKKAEGIAMEAFMSAPEVKKTPTTDDDIYTRLGWMDDGFDL